MSTRAEPAIALEFSWQLAELTRPEDYFDAAAELLGRLIPSSGVSRGHMDAPTGLFENRGWPPQAFTIRGMSDDWLSARMLSVAAGHPMINTYFHDHAHGVPRRTSDVTTLTDLRRTEAYAFILRPLGWLNQLTILTELHGTTTGTEWVFDRGVHSFTDEEVEIARLLQPILRVLDTAATEFLRSPATDETPLTPREIEVLSWVARGLTARAVGSYLRISEATVNKHLENAYRKLGATSRVSAIDHARRSGVLR